MALLQGFVIPFRSATPGNPAPAQYLQPMPPSGDGYLAGSYPDGITNVDGVPVSALVRVLYRPEHGALGDGVVVASTVSAADGTWSVTGLDPERSYDVVARKGGLNDTLMSDITPLSDSRIYVSDVNIMRSGMYVSHTLHGNLSAYDSASPTRINDGLWATSSNITDRGYARTTFGGSEVNGAEVRITFSEPVALGRMGLGAYSEGQTYVFEAYVDSAWVTVSSQTAKGSYTTMEYYDFNESAEITSSMWRWRITGWVSANNFYAFEVEAFRFEQ